MTDDELREKAKAFRINSTSKFRPDYMLSTNMAEQLMAMFAAECVRDALALADAADNYCDRCGDIVQVNAIKRAIRAERERIAGLMEFAMEGGESRSREYLERYDAREMARERLRRAYLKVVGDWRWVEGQYYTTPFLDATGEWTYVTQGNAIGVPTPYKFEMGDQATQFGTDNDADLRTVMEADDER